MRRLGVLIVLSILPVAVVVSPATASGGTTRGSNGVLFECDDRAYSYSIDLPEDAYDWSMEVTVRGPDGLEATSDFVYDELPTGTSEFQLCSSDLPGRYTIEAEVDWYDSEYNESSFTLRPSYFVMRSPRSRTALVASPRRAARGQVIKFKVTSKEERPNGYYPSEYTQVSLQAKRGRRWVNIRGARGSTNARGKVTFRVRYAGGIRRIRARTVPAGYENVSASTSRPVVIRGK